MGIRNRFPSRPIDGIRILKDSDEQTTNSDTLPDGLEALRRELSLSDVMGLIERTAHWVDPKTFRYLPVWYPEHARRALFYKANWSEPQMNRNRQTGVTIHKSEGNVHANKALTLALGLRAGERPNWSYCHIWGIDDALYQVSNAVVQDRRFFSCVANMVLLPTPLKAFTDVMTDVKMMLRVCALHLYGWSCDHDDVAEIAGQVADWANWDDIRRAGPNRVGRRSRWALPSSRLGSRRRQTVGRPPFARIWYPLVRTIRGKMSAAYWMIGTSRFERSKPPPHAGQRPRDHRRVRRQLRGRL